MTIKLNLQFKEKIVGLERNIICCLLKKDIQTKKTEKCK